MDKKNTSKIIKFYCEIKKPIVVKIKNQTETHGYENEKPVVMKMKNLM